MDLPQCIFGKGFCMFVDCEEFGRKVEITMNWTLQHRQVWSYNRRNCHKHWSRSNWITDFMKKKKHCSPAAILVLPTTPTRRDTWCRRVHLGTPHHTHKEGHVMPTCFAIVINNKQFLSVGSDISQVIGCPTPLLIGTRGELSTV